MSDATDAQLIAAFIDRRNFIAHETKKFTEGMQPYRDQMTALQNVMHARLLERKAKNSSTEAGTAFFATSMTVKTADKDAMLRFAIDNFDQWGKNLLTAAVSRETVELYINATKTEENPNGTPPPGVEVSFETEVRFRKA